MLMQSFFVILMCLSIIGFISGVIMLPSLKKLTAKDGKKNGLIVIGISLLVLVVSIFAFSLSPNSGTTEKTSDPTEANEPLKISVSDKFMYSDHFGYDSDKNGKADIVGKTKKNAKVELKPNERNDVSLKEIRTTADSKGIFHFYVTLPSTVDFIYYDLVAETNENVSETYNVEVYNQSDERQKINETEESKPENILASALSESDVSDYKTKIEGSNVIISYPIESFWNADSLVAVTYPKDVEKILENLQGTPFESIIIQLTTTFTDDKGNESEGLAISTFFTKQTLDSINFANWSDQISSDGTVLYSASDGYMIQNSLLNESKGKTKTKIGNAGKSNDSDWWTNNGYIELK
jgi:hypothetical protein